MNDGELVDELAEFMAYYCADTKKKEATVAEKLGAVNFYRKQWVELTSPLQHFRIKAVRRRIKSCLLYTSPSPRD